jgi:hypothetical protein
VGIRSPSRSPWGSKDINGREEVMTGTKQQIEREQLRAARPIMFRVLTILATVGALAVTAGPAAALSGSSGAATGNAAATGIIMRDGGICDPIRHMGC